MIDFTKVITQEAKAASKKASTLEQLDANCRKHLDKHVHWSGGVMANDKAKAGKVKAKAMLTWTETVWNEFYTRVAMAEAGLDVETDFSSFVPPHSMQEVMLE